MSKTKNNLIFVLCEQQLRLGNKGGWGEGGGGFTLKLNGRSLKHV